MNTSSLYDSLHANCLACKGIASYFKKVTTYRLFHCPHCGLEFCNPMPTPAQLAHFYQNYHDIRAQENVVRMNASHNLNALTQKLALSKNAQILDFGCGSNLFTEECKAQGFEQSFGYDRYIDALDKKTFLIWESCQNRRWDLITLWGVLEHLTDPVETLYSLKQLVAPGGHLVVSTVCTETSIPFQYKPPEHTLYFSKQSLAALGNAVGLILVECTDYFMLQDSDIYISILLRTMPAEYAKKVTHTLEPFVKIPTNEVLAIFSRK